MKIKILGTEYEIVTDAEEKDYPMLKDADGYADFTIGKIVIKKLVQDGKSYEDLELWQRKTLRHEIVHAFLYESGLWQNSFKDWARNEEMTDWIAIQFEKMFGVFIEAGAISSIGIDVNVYDRTSNNPINDPINPPKVKEDKAYIKLPNAIPLDVKMPTNSELVDMINKAVKDEPKGYIVGGLNND